MHSSRHSLRSVVNILPAMEEKERKKKKDLCTQRFKSSFKLAELPPPPIPQKEQTMTSDSFLFMKISVWSSVARSRPWLLDRSVCLALLDALDKQKHSSSYLAFRYSTWFELNLIFCRGSITAQLGVKRPREGKGSRIPFTITVSLCSPVPKCLGCKLSA